MISSCNQSETDNLIIENNRLTKKVDSLDMKLDSISNLSSFNFQTALEYEENAPNESKEIYEFIIKSDSSSFWKNQAKKRLSFLTSKENKMNFINELSGAWTWKETYTNWGEINSPFKCGCNQELKIIDGETAEFYRNDSLIRRTEIDITTEPDLLGGHLFKLIKFKDKNEIRQLLISENGQKLSFTEPYCECGCVTDVYKKKK